jgi:hypothetical protein
VIEMKNEFKYELVRNPHDNRYKVVDFGDFYGCPYGDAPDPEDAIRGAVNLGINREDILTF